MIEQETSLDKLNTKLEKAEDRLAGAQNIVSNIETPEFLISGRPTPEPLRLDIEDDLMFLENLDRVGRVKLRLIERIPAATQEIQDLRAQISQVQISATGTLDFPKSPEASYEVAKQRLQFLEGSTIAFGGEEIELTDKEHRLLIYLSGKIGVQVKTGEILKSGFEGRPAATVHLSDVAKNLQKKLTSYKEGEYLVSSGRIAQASWIKLQGVEVPPVEVGDKRPALEIDLGKREIRIKCNGFEKVVSISNKINWEVFNVFEQNPGNALVPYYPKLMDIPELNGIRNANNQYESVMSAIMYLMTNLNVEGLEPIISAKPVGDPKGNTVEYTFNAKEVTQKRELAQTSPEVEVIGEEVVDFLTQEEAAVIATILTKSNTLLDKHGFEDFPAELAEKLGLGIKLNLDKAGLDMLRIKALEHLRRLLSSDQPDQIYNNRPDMQYTQSLITYFIDRQKALDLLEDLINADIEVSWRISKGEVVDITSVVVPRRPEVIPKAPGQLFDVKEIPFVPVVCTPLERSILRIIIDQLSQEKKLSFSEIQRLLYRLAVEVHISDRFRVFGGKNQFRILQPEEMRKIFSEGFRKIRLPGGTQGAEDLQLLSDLSSVMEVISGGNAQRFQRSIGVLIDNAERDFYNKFQPVSGETIVWLDIDRIGA